MMGLIHLAGNLPTVCRNLLQVGIETALRKQIFLGEILRQQPRL